MSVACCLLENTPIGPLSLYADNDALIAIHFGDKNDGIRGSTSVLLDAKEQLQAYFTGDLKEFTVSLAPHGTDFQKTVWSELQRIPWGDTCTYGDIAKRIGDAKASRAVGMANNRNPIPIIIPCHRVVGANGKLVGYAGGLDVKHQLLSIERTLLL